MSTTFQIAELTAAWDGGRCAPVQERLRGAVETKIADAHRQIAEPTTLVADLQRAATSLSSTPVEGPCDDTCGCTSDTSPTLGDGRARSQAAVSLIAKPATSSGDGGEVPIACTLAAGEMSSRLEEWRVLLEDKGDLLRGVTARHGLDDGLRLEFGPDADVTEIARLAAAEQSCCRFFRFALVIDNRGIALEIHAPPDGPPVLTALFGAAA
jgi:MerR family transcriptional regulator, copper efflux regulator